MGTSNSFRTKWIVLGENGEFECLRCGTKYKLKTPISVPMFCTAGKLFLQGHRNCKEVAHG